MTEQSILWTTDGVGDGINDGYTMAQVTEWMRMLAAGLTGADLSGVAPDYLNELAVTGTSSPVAVDTGAAIVYGFLYFNSVSVNVVVATPSTSTRVDLIVLEVDWTAQTVRIASVAGTEGAGAPSLTQTAGTTWQMKLAEASITTGGVITVTDTREWLGALGLDVVNSEHIAAGAVDLEHMSANSVDSDQYVDGSIDTVHIMADQITSALIADDQIDSEHVAAGAIDNEHMAANSIDSDQYVDGSIDPVHIGTLNLADLDDVTETTPLDGHVLTYDTGAWVNAAAGGGGAEFMIIPMIGQIAWTLTDSATFIVKNMIQGWLYFDPDDFPAGATVKLVVHAVPQNGANPAEIQLYDKTGSAAITGAAVSITDTAATALAVTGDFKANLTAGLRKYALQERCDGNSGTFGGAFLLVEW